jgi:1-acyl-sn-glycerol-3-phosphate acyltransferase
MAAFSGGLARKALWRMVLTLTGGLRILGVPRLPDGPCVIVANHNSHADTAALIAALPARRRPAVAAAADYWFDGTTSGLRSVLAGAGLRPWACQALCGAFPVRRGGGGTADLEGAARLLAAGRDVVIYPEGSRSRDGSIGEFRHGAARLAVLTGVPLVPVGITGTRELLPAAGTGVRRRRSAVTVRIGLPIHGGIAAATAGSAVTCGSAAANGSTATAGSAGSAGIAPPAAGACGADAKVASRPRPPGAVSGMTAEARVRVAMLTARRGEGQQDRVAALSQGVRGRLRRASRGVPAVPAGQQASQGRHPAARYGGVVREKAWEASELASAPPHAPQNAAV